MNRVGHLEEHRRGWSSRVAVAWGLGINFTEGLLRLWRSEDRNCLIDARELLGPNAGPLRPLNRLRLASFLGLREELLVGFELDLQVFQLLLAVRELLDHLRLLLVELHVGVLERLELVLLRRDELLEGLLLLRFLPVLLLELRGESVVHAL